MEEKDFKRLLEEQALIFDKSVDAKLAIQSKTIEQAVDKKLAVQAKVIEKAVDKKIAAAVIEIDKHAQERTERYLGALQEEHTWRLDAIKENTTPLLGLPAKVDHLQETVDEMKYTVDATFEQVGRLTEDAEALKETVVRHEVILQRK